MPAQTEIKDDPASANSSSDRAACPIRQAAGEVVLFAPETARRTPAALPDGDAPGIGSASAKAATSSSEPGDKAAPFTPDAVQSNVIRSVNPARAHYIFFRVTDAEAFRRLLGSLTNPPPQADGAAGSLDGLPPEARRFWSEAQAHRYDDKGRRRVVASTWNIAFTWPGLKALGIDANTLASFPEDFRDGMAARASRLGDVGASAPDHWQGWLGSREVHGVLMVNLQAAPDGDDLPSRLALGLFKQPSQGALPKVAIVDLLDKLPRSGMRVLHAELGERIPSPLNHAHRIEHFGFRDGVSQPFAGADLGTPRPPPPGGGTARPDGTWDPIALGELLLGHPDEDGLIQARPANEELRRDGTYMVFRKLEQDVVGFRRYLREHGGSMARESVLAAQMMGRWPDGASLVRAGVWPTDAVDDRTINDFRYGAEDPQGLRCPLGAHARRVNPRDSNDRDEARRHRIWRRSITYGDFLPYDSSGDGKPRGLLFVAMCARIDQQFEFLQTRWLNTGEFVGQAGIGRCPITGANTGDIEDTFAAPGRVAPYTNLPRFVRTKGGDYFFVPSLPALEKLVNGETFPSPPEPIAHNPGLDKTPKIDLEQWVALGKERLLPTGVPAWLQPDPRVPLVLVGRHKYVLRVLGDDRRFSLADMDRRMRQICGGERLMLGLPEGDPDRTTRIRMWSDAARRHGEPSWTAITQGAMQTILARHGPAGALDIVRHVAMVVPMAFARGYLGVTGPNWVSPAYVASLFARTEISDVPRDWLAKLPPVPQQDVPFTTLQAWAQTAFTHVFANIVDAAELAGLARRTTAEFFRHLDGLIAEIDPRQNPRATLLQCFMSLDPTAYGLTTQRFAVIVRLIMAELIVGSAGTLSQAVPNFVDYLLDHPDIVDSSRFYSDDELDAIVREGLRFRPVAPAIFRQCSADTLLGGRMIPKGHTVAVLLKTAMFDPRVFPRPEAFLTDPTLRDPKDYLVFGAGLHECRGASIGAPVIRETVRPLIALPDLHRAAGPLGADRDPLNRWRTLKVRFKPIFK
jgi:Dyp-type peroxidase family